MYICWRSLVNSPDLAPEEEHRMPAKAQTFYNISSLSPLLHPILKNSSRFGPNFTAFYQDPVPKVLLSRVDQHAPYHSCRHLFSRLHIFCHSGGFGTCHGAPSTSYNGNHAHRSRHGLRWCSRPSRHTSTKIWGCRGSNSLGWRHKPHSKSRKLLRRTTFNLLRCKRRCT